MNTTAADPRPLRELIAFFAWTLGITYLVWGPLAIFRIPAAAAGAGSQAGIGLLPFIVGGFLPSIVGIALTARTEGRAGLARLWRRAAAFRFPLRWYLAMLAAPCAVGGTRLLAQWALGSQIHPAEPLAALMASPLLWIAFAIQIVFLGPLSEEFGWRGYALDRVLARFTPLAGSLLLGTVWALWHLPLFFIPGTSQSAPGQPVPQFAIFALSVLGLTVIITWLYNRTGRSLGAAVATHFLVNFTGTLVAYLMQPSLLDAAISAAGYLAVAAIIVLVTRGNLGAVPRRSATAA